MVRRSKNESSVVEQVMYIPIDEEEIWLNDTTPVYEFVRSDWKIVWI